MGKKITMAELISAKGQNKKFAAVSCYDFTTARLAAGAGVEMILVGDSAAQFMLGFDSTLPVTMDFMVAITAGVRRGAPDVCLVADMPFLSYQVSVEEAIKNAGRFVKEAGVDLIKIEATRAQLDVVKAVSDAEMAVMAHIGIRPQSISKTGVLKAEGVSAEAAFDLIELADRMVEAGATMLLVEGAATEVAKIITERSSVPVLSCGAGGSCDGQILVVNDILGLTESARPKFSKSFGKLAKSVSDSIKKYSDEVKANKFPDDEHSYHIKGGELEKLEKMLGNG